MDPVTLGIMGIGAVSGYFSQQSSKAEQRRMRRLMREQLNFARERWRHYRETYGDLEKQMVADAMEGVRADYAGAASRAAADVESAAATARDTRRRDLQRYGLDPSSGRYQSSERRAGLEEATASALAQNRAREGERRYSEAETFRRRSGVGQFGASMMMTAGQNYMGAMGNMADMHGRNADREAVLANNLFGQAGMIAGMSAGGATPTPAAPTSAPMTAAYTPTPAYTPAPYFGNSMANFQAAPPTNYGLQLNQPNQWSYQ